MLQQTVRLSQLLHPAVCAAACLLAGANIWRHCWQPCISAAADGMPPALTGSMAAQHKFERCSRRPSFPGLRWQPKSLSC